MKRYFDLKDFIAFLHSLEVDKPTSLFVETVIYEEEVEGEIGECKFQKINFCGECIVLYDILRGSVGLIQNTPVAPWEDYAESVYEDLVQEGENKIFIKV